MDEVITDFFVPSLPIAQPRPRVFSVAGKARAIEAPSKHPIHQFKHDVMSSAQKSYARNPTDSQVCLSCNFLFPRPKAMRWKTRDMPRVYKPKKPDLDNLAKAVIDALTGIIWIDDSQVVQLFAAKRLVSGSYQDGTYSEEVSGVQVSVFENQAV